MNEQELNELMEKLRGKSDHDLLIHLAAQVEMMNRQMADGDARMTAIEEEQKNQIKQRQICYDRMADIKVESVSTSRVQSIIVSVIVMVFGAVFTYLITK